MSEAAKTLLPAVNYLCIPEAGVPYLQGLKCRNCGAIYFDERKHCAKCASRNSLQAESLSSTGKLVAFTVVQRSYPGIPVPFISAIVDLDSGGTLKGNLINIEADPASIRVGMSVEVVYQQAPWGDEKGNQYLMFYFQPKK